MAKKIKDVLDNEIEIELKKNRIFNNTIKEKIDQSNFIVNQEDVFFDKIISHIANNLNDKLIFYIINELKDIKDNHLITYVDDTQCFILNNIALYNKLKNYYLNLLNFQVKFL